MKITRAESRLHDEACERLTQKDLTEADREFIFNHWTPMASHNVGKAGIFFTPLWIADAFAVYASSGDGTTVVDLGAGIGALTYKLMEHDRTRSVTYVCIEIEEEFVKIGKKLVPDAHWYHGDALDQDLLKRIVAEHPDINVAIANPPYGSLNKNGRDWLLTKGPLQWMFMEVAIRIAYSGGMFLVPEIDCDYKLDIRDAKGYVKEPGHFVDKPRSQQYLGKNFPGVHLLTIADDLTPDEDEEDQGWQGANPTTRIADLNLDDCEFDRPYGLERKQLKVKETRRAEQLPDFKSAEQASLF